MSSPLRRTDHLLAGIVTGVVLTGLAALWLWTEPRGCATRGDPTTYLWVCLLPILLVSVAPVTAVVLGATGMLSRRLAGWITRSWVVTMVLWGALVHLGLAGSMYLNDPDYFAIFLSDILLIPQPALAGALSAAVHVGVLRWRGRRASG